MPAAAGVADEIDGFCWLEVNEFGPVQEYVAPGTIVQVYQPGYVLEDRVLRPAMVVVAKGGEKRGGEDKSAAQRKASDDAA